MTGFIAGGVRVDLSQKDIGVIAQKVARYMHHKSIMDHLDWVAREADLRYASADGIKTVPPGDVSKALKDSGIAFVLMVAMKWFSYKNRNSVEVVSRRRDLYDFAALVAGDDAPIPIDIDEVVGHYEKIRGKHKNLRQEISDLRQEIREINRDKRRKRRHDPYS